MLVLFHSDTANGNVHVRHSKCTQHCSFRVGGVFHTASVSDQIPLLLKPDCKFCPVGIYGSIH